MLTFGDPGNDSRMKRSKYRKISKTTRNDYAYSTGVSRFLNDLISKVQLVYNNMPINPLYLAKVQKSTFLFHYILLG